jgi:hypothetical protein
VADEVRTEQILMEEVGRKISTSSSYLVDIHIGVFKDDWHYHFGTHEIPLHVQQFLDDSLRKRSIK